MNEKQNQAERFCEALQKSESKKNIEPLVELFAEDACLENLSSDEPFRGKDGVERFWNNYLKQFDQVNSSFKQVTETESGAILEWTSSGTLPGGKEIEYRGVSVLEFSDNEVQNFRTYYDSAAFIDPSSATSATSKNS